VVVPGSNWQTTKYEVVDGTIIYPPNGVDISTLKLVTHIELSVSDTINNKVEIKSLQICSQALSLDTTIENPVYTKYETKITPYTYTVVGGTRTYDYSGIGNAKNPFIMEKNTSPHLSLERLSGIRLLDLDYGASGVNRGIRIDINKTQKAKSKVKSIQMFLYYDSKKFYFTGAEIFNIVAAGGEVFSTILGDPGSINPNNSSVLGISTKNSSGATVTGITYYINGKLEATPLLRVDEWTVLTMVFTTPISFDNISGEFNITGPFAIDNIVLYGLNDQEYTGGHNNASNAERLYGSFIGINILDPGEYNREDRITVHDMQYNVYADYKTAKYTYDAN
jgi:hypothetical protein